jgi:hypothetical protein
MKRISRGALASALVAGLCIPVFMAAPAQAANQFIQADADFDDNTWNDSDGSVNNELFDDIDENTSDGATSYIESVQNPSGDFAIVQLENPTDPEINTNHWLRVNARKGSDGGKNVQLQYDLYQTATFIDGCSTGNLTNVFTEFECKLDPTAVETITNYAALRIRVTGTTSGSGDARAIRVTWAELEVAATDLDDCLDDPNAVDVDGGGTALETALVAETSPMRFCIDAADSPYESPSTGLSLQTGDILDGEGVVDPNGSGVPGSPAPHTGDSTGHHRPEVRINAEAGAQWVYDDNTGANDVELYDITFAGGVDVSEVEDTCHDSEVGADECGSVLEPGDNWFINRVRITNGETNGIRSAGTDLVLDNVEVDNNGVDETSPFTDGPFGTGGVSAGIKSGQAGAFTVLNSYIHNNDQGVWCDTDCENNNTSGPLGAGFVVDNSEIINNCSFGIHYEYTQENEDDGGAATDANALITDNDVRGNNYCNLATPKADIGIISAENAEVMRNTMGTKSEPSSNTEGFNDDSPGDGFEARETLSRGPSTGTYYVSGSNENFPNADSEVCFSPYVTSPTDICT